MLALTTVYLEYVGYDCAGVWAGGRQLLIYNKNFGGVLVPHSGIFRASEIAAWHAMTCACFVLLLVNVAKSQLLDIC